MSAAPALSLAWILATPLAATLVIALNAKRPRLGEAIGVIAALLTFAQVAALTPTVLAGGRPTLVMLSVMDTIPLVFTLDPLGLLFALVAAALWIPAGLYSIAYLRANHEAHQPRFHAYFALAIACTLGIALAGNLFTLFLFYEALTLSTYPLITHQGTAQAVRAGRIYMGMLLVPSIGLLLVAIILTHSLAGRMDFQPGGILAGRIDGPLVGLLLALFVFGTAKAALMPFHRWLPAAMVAPTPVSALLHAVAVVKAGVFTIAKVVISIFGIDLLAASSWTGWLTWVAGISVILASLIALRQDNLKRRLAYSTISQLAYVVMALSLFSPLGVLAAGLHIVVHAFGKITLFFAAGAIHTATHKDSVSQFAGIGRAMPWTMGAFAVASLSMIGLPPTAGFLSKWGIFSAAFQGQTWGVVAVLIASTVLNAAYFLPILHTAFLKPPPGEAGAKIAEAPPLMVAALCLTAFGTLALFFLPGLPFTLARQLAGVGP
ncbi:proton-conducting transporter transmembrane domain-containing protein [Rhodospirillum rubrum]|uniref:NADH dehydrogenase (Quinone) n=1 Tax=Rhodospirillum rubrum (strain ATCC 11170 / ATH 1.1.1 / DSM 467 / LMG 4362 / NCIMB 8255 / S1) TaxID=269796 RepID=Q2RTW1_RHORT|nr:proton-conducting transporter membrane subunit [Rhodospirillum rubrum]ABC22434.1 NADH dehydrogenase (quinone) [Rhodospirillum rubrum ATCC 11170]AEO48152.1 NADH dehydrogenase (quinone) [Rhodospirillum rubrum F11]MBK5954015.1 cation:proton antiporter [Rhodospirillum rubrum]QXG82070.1 monovalent cation/H+ antiporter subunit D family protein [Rhodospirillum rubrum]HAP99360.1 cation:proton antiporter [Rhodospirillum rubrum]